MTDLEARSRFIKQEAYRLGFELVGIAEAKELTEEAKRLEQWLKQHQHGSMAYMENHFDKRINPRKLVDGAKTVISLGYNYYTESSQSDKESPKISKYAYGKDYHFVVKDKLKELLSTLQNEFGAINGRCFVDSAPVLERDWAKHSGIGWTGRNTLTINPKKGSYFFLAELIIDLSAQADHAMKDYCGTCRRCIDACPTEAIHPNGYWLDASKCISYLTIELKEAIPSEFKGKMDNWMFGCDVCQDVCPWNRFSKPHNEPEFEPFPQLLSYSKKQWEEITHEVFTQLFKDSAVKRTKFEGLRRNIGFLRGE